MLNYHGKSNNVGFVIALYTRNELLIVKYKLHRCGITNIPRDTHAAIRVLHYFYTIKIGVNMAPDFSFLSIQRYMSLLLRVN